MLLSLRQVAARRSRKRSKSGRRKSARRRRSLGHFSKAGRPKKTERPCQTAGTNVRGNPYGQIMLISVANISNCSPSNQAMMSAFVTRTVHSLVQRPAPDPSTPHQPSREVICQTRPSSSRAILPCTILRRWAVGGPPGCLPTDIQDEAGWRDHRGQCHHRSPEKSFAHE